MQNPQIWMLNLSQILHVIYSLFNLFRKICCRLDWLCFKHWY